MADLTVENQSARWPEDYPVTGLNLYCWQHNTVHAVPLADVERVVYALTVAFADAFVDTKNACAGEPSREHMPCPMAIASEWAGDNPGVYADWVEQGVGCREAAEVSTDG